MQAAFTSAKTGRTIRATYRKRVVYLSVDGGPERAFPPLNARGVLKTFRSATA